MSSDSKKSTQVTVRLTEELHEQIEAEAKEQKRKKADMIRIIVEEYFENKGRLKKIAERK
ncbi:hypothetical protein FACS18949_13400 [Clostridia bacterium]|nr:hypothetical protein FACS189425_06880 [Clostridia bacterium]GHV35431.1 hypothetical protein FACS18949_13400 [Clostridia bacterium]